MLEKKSKDKINKNTERFSEQGKEDNSSKKIEEVSKEVSKETNVNNVVKGNLVEVSNPPANAGSSKENIAIKSDEAKASEQKVEHFKPNDEDELLKFVYGDDSDSGETEGLGKFFKGMDVTRDVKNAIDNKISCPIMKTDDNTLPISTTCDPQLAPVSLKDLDKKVKANCNIQKKIPVMMLKEYEDESSMNGGKLYGDLSAYDSLLQNYEDYQCMKNI
jgi:hypothetical protein